MAQESQTLQHVMATLARGGVGYSGGSPTVEALGLRSLLLAREAKGVARYGKTLDDQPAGPWAFWLRMGLEEFADGLMYIQKALDAAERIGDYTHTRELEYTMEQLAKAAFILLRVSCRPLLDRIEAGGINPALFPPCDLREITNHEPG